MGDDTRVVVYNDDRNTFKNVINLLNENTNKDPVACSLIAESIDEHGKMPVYTGDRKYAEQIRDNLKDGGLHVELVDLEWYIITRKKQKKFRQIQKVCENIRNELSTYAKTTSVFTRHGVVCSAEFYCQQDDKVVNFKSRNPEEVRDNLCDEIMKRYELTKLKGCDEWCLLRPS